MTGTNCKNHCSWRLLSPSLTLSVSCQSSLLIAAAVQIFPIVLLTVQLFIPCVTVLFLSHCFVLSWPGSSCKWELVLNWPMCLNKSEIYIYIFFLNSLVRRPDPASLHEWFATHGNQPGNYEATLHHLCCTGVHRSFCHRKCCCAVGLTLNPVSYIGARQLYVIRAVPD